MENFNAKEAQRLVDETSDTDIHSILIDIKMKAKNGETELQVYKSLRAKTVSELRNRGFKVFDHSSIAIQKDNLYYSISWEK